MPGGCSKPLREKPMVQVAQLEQASGKRKDSGSIPGQSVRLFLLINFHYLNFKMNVAKTFHIVFITNAGIKRGMFYTFLFVNL